MQYLTLAYSLIHSLSLSPAKLLKHRQVKYCITIVLVWSKSNIFNPFGDTWHFERWAAAAAAAPRAARALSREGRAGGFGGIRGNSLVSIPSNSPASRGTSPELSCYSLVHERNARRYVVIDLIIKNTYGGIDETLRWLLYLGLASEKLDGERRPLSRAFPCPSHVVCPSCEIDDLEMRLAMRICVRWRINCRRYAPAITEY